MPNLACPTCHRPIDRVKRNQDARCQQCKADLKIARRERESEER